MEGDKTPVMAALAPAPGQQLNSAVVFMMGSTGQTSNKWSRENLVDLWEKDNFSGEQLNRPVCRCYFWQQLCLLVPGRDGWI